MPSQIFTQRSRVMSSLSSVWSKVRKPLLEPKHPRYEYPSILAGLAGLSVTAGLLAGIDVETTGSLAGVDSAAAGSLAGADSVMTGSLAGVDSVEPTVTVVVEKEVIVVVVVGSLVIALVIALVVVLGFTA